jgi:hypothetical protein
MVLVEIIITKEGKRREGARVLAMAFISVMPNTHAARPMVLHMAWNNYLPEEYYYSKSRNRIAITGTVWFSSAPSIITYRALHIYIYVWTRVLAAARFPALFVDYL